MDAVEDDNDDIYKLPMSLQNTLKKKNKKQKKNQGGMGVGVESLTQVGMGMINVECMAYNQILAAKVAENALKDLKEQGEAKISMYEGVNTELKTIQENYEAVKQQKQEY